MNEPLRILTIADVPPDPDSGAAGTVFHTNEAFRRLGHAVDEVWADDLGPRRIRHGNLHSLLEQPRAYAREAVRRVRSRRYDVVQMSQPQAYLAAKALRARGFGGLIVNRSHGVELRVDEVLPAWHRRLGMPESRWPVATAVLRRLLARQWQGIARNCHGVVVGCRLDRDFLIERLGLPADRVVAIAHGVAPTFLQAPAAVANDERARSILHVGQFAFIKGSTLIPTIVNRTLAAERDARFTWVCEARYHAAIRSQLDPAIAERVSLRGWGPLADLVEIYDRHGVFLFPSLFEGFGKAPAEAMARGLAVLASDEGGMRDIIRNGENGLLAPVGDVDSFVVGLRQLLAEPERIRAMGAAAAESVNHLSWDRCAAEARAFYQRLIVAAMGPGRGDKPGQAASDA